MITKKETSLETSDTGGNLGAKKMPTVDTSGRFKTKNKKHEAKIAKNLIIEDFRVGLLNISVDWYRDDFVQTESLFLCKPCFEQWLNDTGRLDWCKDGLDDVGEYIQDHTTMPVDDYWEHADYEQKLKDLKRYIAEERLV